jgi:hypothetical protein
VPQRSLKLLTDAREIKSKPFSSVDCVGCAIGKAQIADRVTSELRTLWPSSGKKGGGGEGGSGGGSGGGGTAELDAAMATHAPAIAGIDANDAMHKWWTSLDTYDGFESVAARQHEFIRELVYAPETVSITAGHSLYFMRFFATHARPDLVHGKNADSDLARLGQKKLPNCGCVAVLLDTEAADSECVAGVKFMWGTENMPKWAKHWADRGEPTDDSALRDPTSEFTEEDEASHHEVVPEEHRQAMLDAHKTHVASSKAAAKLERLRSPGAAVGDEGGSELRAPEPAAAAEEEA